jgi:uncharacterized repeat protein (TIGR03803 family)
VVSSPDALAIIEAADGTLYGITADDGQYGGGTLFTLSAAGTYSVLHAFGAPAGSWQKVNTFLCPRRASHRPAARTASERCPVRTLHLAAAG